MLLLPGHPHPHSRLSTQAHLARTSLQLFTTVPLSLNLLSFCLPLFFSFFYLPWFYWRRSVPIPPACLKWPAHISQPFLAGYPPSSCLSLSFSPSPLFPPSLGSLTGGSVGVRGTGIPVNSISFLHFNRILSGHAPPHIGQ